MLYDAFYIVTGLEDCKVKGNLMQNEGQFMKRISGTVAKGLVIGLLLVAWLFVSGAWGKPTTPEQAKTVVANWLAQEAQPLGAPLGGQVREVQTFKDRAGNPLITWSA